MGQDIEIKNELTQFIPVDIKDNKAYPLKTNGSGDCIALSKGMIETVPLKGKIDKGESLLY
ncbi:MAG: hypothetical protein ACRC0A_07030 [Chitinophagaceae bacterium]